MRWLLRFIGCTILSFIIVSVIGLVLFPIFTNFIESVIPNKDEYAGITAFLTMGEFSWKGALIISIIGGLYLSSKN